MKVCLSWGGKEREGDGQRERGGGGERNQTLDLLCVCLRASYFYASEPFIMHEHVCVYIYRLDLLRSVHLMPPTAPCLAS